LAQQLQEALNALVRSQDVGVIDAVVKHAVQLPREEARPYAPALLAAAPVVARSDNVAAICNMTALAVQFGTLEQQRAYVADLRPALGAVAHSGSADAIGSMAALALLSGTPEDKVIYAAGLGPGLGTVTPSENCPSIGAMAALAYACGSSEQQRIYVDGLAPGLAAVARSGNAATIHHMSELMMLAGTLAQQQTFATALEPAYGAVAGLGNERALQSVQKLMRAVAQEKLFAAAMYGNVEALRDLVSMPGCDVNVRRSGDAATAIGVAAQHGHVDAVRVLAGEFHARVDIPDNGGNTPLHAAAVSGHGDVVRALVSDFHAPAEARNVYSVTPLLLAAEAGHAGICKLLVDGGAGVDTPGMADRTPLHIAASNGRIDVVRMLTTELGAEVDGRDGNEKTPLWHAAQAGDAAVCKQLAEMGANVNVRGEQGQTPLHGAAQEGHPDVVRMLVTEWRAEVDARDENGATPFFLAAAEGHADVCKLLAELGANLNVLDNDGWTPLGVAVFHEHVNVVGALAELGAPIPPTTAMTYRHASGNVRRELDAWRAAHQAVHDGATLEYALCEVKVHDGATLEDAPREVDVRVFRRLVCRDHVDLGEVDSVGRTFLHRAAAHNGGELVTYLLAEGLGPGAKAADGDTALHEAARHGAKNAMAALLASRPNADVLNARDCFGETAWHIAVNHAVHGSPGHEAIAVQLQEAGASRTPPPLPPNTKAFFPDPAHYQNEPFFQTDASLHVMRSFDCWRKQCSFDAASQPEPPAIDQTPGSASANAKRGREVSLEPASRPAEKRARTDGSSPRLPPSVPKGRGNR
jgi:ankyrin repeat protein